MADSPPPPSLSDWPAPQIPLPLADLRPTTTTTSDSSTYITAVVTLIWPFSSSSRTLSVIASEPNPLLRLNKGQLRINFHGQAATAVDKHGLQSGDHICVSLSSARWDELPSAGPRDVPWAVSFERSLAMKVKAGDEWSSIDINADVDTDLAPEQSPAAVEEPSAPPPAQLNGGDWVAPSLFKRRITSSPNSEPSNVFSIGGKGLFDGADDEYDLGHRRKRARFSSSSFRFEEDAATATAATMGESDSSTLEEALMNGLASSAEEAEETEVEAATTATTATAMGGEGMAIERPPIAVGNPNHVGMPPPPPPPPQLALNTNFDVGDTPDSPDLKPVPSEQLPIISPFLGKGLAGLDYMDYNSLRARDAEAAGEVAGAEEISQGSTGSSTLRNESLDGFRSTPEVVIVPVNDEERDESTTSRPESPTKLSAKPPTTTTTPGPSDAQKRADQRRGSFSEEDRFPSDYESEKDSLFDEFSDNELRRRRTTKSRTLGRSPLKSVESLKPRPRTTPLRSRLTLETTAITPETPIKEEGGEHPKTPFLYLPTPSPKTEKRGIQFPPTSAPPKFMSREYESVLGGDITSPIRRRSSFWGMREEPVPDEIDAFFGGGKGVEVERETESASGTEEGFSGFSTPMQGDEEEDENDYQDEDEEEEEDEDEESFGLELGFRSGITTNLSDFPALRSLTWGAVVDLIAVVTRSWPPARAKRGQKDYYTSMRIVDSSFPAGMTATVLRPHQESLPVVRVGDVVLLRSFKITTHKHDFVATSTPNSAWAVWREHGKGRPVITGPPVEYGEGEEAYVAAIAEWFERLEPEVREGMVKGSAGEGDDDFDL